MRSAERQSLEAYREQRAHETRAPSATPAGMFARVAAPVVHSLTGMSILPRRDFQGDSAGETGTDAERVVDPAVPQVTGATTPEGGTPVTEGAPEGGGTLAAPSAEGEELQTGGTGTGGTGGTPVATAPTLTFSPGTTLTRGDTLTATVNYTPPAGSTLVITRWRYTAGTVNVTRPTSDANYNTDWSGTMVTSGTLEMSYRIDQGRTRGTVAQVTESITVNDRSGAPWASSITENAEVPFTGQPSPPERFPQLGRHETAGSTLPQVTAQTVAGGPNKGYTYAQALTAGSYISQPKIHPDLNNPQSAFMVFHQQAGLLYRRPAGGGARTRINQPGITFSGTPATADFNVPNWETFYKAISHFAITFRRGRNSYTLVDADWTLDSNARDSNMSITPTGDGHIRTALGLSASDALPTPTITPAGSFLIFKLLGGPAILSGTQSHEYAHAVHSHRGNYRKMMRALDPQRKSESKLFNPGVTETFANTINGWWTQIGNGMASHKLVDEAQSQTDERFVDNGSDMAGVNEDPANGNALLGNVWNITGDDLMRN